MRYDEYLSSLDKATGELILITNHPKCITLGKNATMQDVLNAGNISIFRSNRGGGVTYHDEGQIVLYPRINLKTRNISLRNYIFTLEEWGILTLHHFGITAYRTEQPGLWYNEHKIAFIGLAIKNGFSQHGIAFNLQHCIIENFEKIIPCKSKIKINKINVSLDDFAEKLSSLCPFTDISIEKNYTNSIS